MSPLTKNSRITVKPFAKVPALLDLPEILRPPASVSNISSFCGANVIDLAEGCLVTKSVKYTHQPVHWINAVCSGDSEVIELVIQRLGIIPYVHFTLDDPCNLAFLEPFLHISLDLYAFIAITASSSTLDELITLVRLDNDRRQVEIDEEGATLERSFNFTISSFTNPQYELVSLHPEHFLPVGSVLTIYNATTKIYKNYIPARDRYLRESHDPLSPRFPTFYHNQQNREKIFKLNVFLVILNADIKFRRYTEMVKRYPPITPLPDEVLTLMHRTMELVELIYWRPVPTPGSEGEAILATLNRVRRQNLGRAARPGPTTAIERGTSEEMDEDGENISNHLGRQHVKLPWPEGADLETRMAYGRALMCGHDREYDPELFEDAFPLNDTPPMYSDREILAAWNREVSS